MKLENIAYFCGPNLYLTRNTLFFTVNSNEQSLLKRLISNCTSFMDFQLIDSESSTITAMLQKLLFDQQKLHPGYELHTLILNNDENIQIAFEVNCINVAKLTLLRLGILLKDMSRKDEEELRDINIKIKHFADNSIIFGPTFSMLATFVKSSGVPYRLNFDDNTLEVYYGRNTTKLSSTARGSDNYEQVEQLSNKLLTKQIIEGRGYAQLLTKGAICDSKSKFLELLNDFEFPIVVKPLNGRKGKLVHTALQNKTEALAAWENITQSEIMFSPVIFQVKTEDSKEWRTYSSVSNLLTDCINFSCSFKLKIFASPEEVIWEGTLTDKNSLALRLKIELAKVKLREPVLIENHVQGHDHRILTIDGQLVSVTAREVASIIGNGKATIEELINKENLRRHSDKKNHGRLGQILIDRSLQAHLARSELQLSSVPLKNQVVPLSSIPNLSQGGVSRNITDEVHSETKLLMEKLANYFDIYALGFDVICEDISKSWRNQQFKIIEINSAPGIFMHKYPAFGEGDNVEEQFIAKLVKAPETKIHAYYETSRLRLLWDLVLFKLKNPAQKVDMVDMKTLTNKSKDAVSKLTNKLSKKIDALFILHSQKSIFEFGVVHQYCHSIIGTSQAKPCAEYEVLRQTLTQ